MKIYLAGSYKCRADVDLLAQELVDKVSNVEIVSRWHSQGEEEEEIKRRGKQHFINLDVEDIERADLLIFLNCPPYAISGSTGRWVEYGIAIGRRMPIIAYGGLDYSLFLDDDLTFRVEDYNREALIQAVRLAELMFKWEERQS